VLSDVSPTLAFVAGAGAYLVAALLWVGFGVGQRARTTRDSSQTGPSDS
jgi:hypothetical protein